MTRTFHFSIARYGKNVSGKRCLNLGVVEMNNLTIILNHIHLHIKTLYSQHAVNTAIYTHFGILQSNALQICYSLVPHRSQVWS
jgi:hypothetical protein